MCQLEGGLKCFGRPVGATGLRTACEVSSQFQSRPGERQRGKADLGLTHNLAGRRSTASPQWLLGNLN